MLRLLYILIFGFIFLPIVYAEDKPQHNNTIKPERIVSINLCTDQLVLSIADLNNISSVTWLSLTPSNSIFYEKAEEISIINRGNAEEIIPLDPDIIFAGAYTTPFTIQMLTKFGFRVEVLGVPQNLEEVKQQILYVGNLLHEVENAEKLVAEMNLVLDQLPTSQDPAVRTAVFQPSGFTVGPGSFEHELLTIAGFNNIAQEAGISYYGFFSLEQLLLLEPELIISPESNTNRPSVAESIINHRALKKRNKNFRKITLPQALWSCGGPMNTAAINLLSSSRF